MIRKGKRKERKSVYSGLNVGKHPTDLRFLMFVKRRELLPMIVYTVKKPCVQDGKY